MSQVRHGICQGGPRDGQTLATMQPGTVKHPDDASGFYVFRAAIGPTPATWQWIVPKKQQEQK